MLDLSLTCDLCHRQPAQLRINDASICSGCAHALIEQTAPRPTSPVRPRERVLARVRRGPVPRGALIRECGGRYALRVLEQLLADGTLEESEGTYVDDRNRMHRVRLVSERAQCAELRTAA